MFAEREHGGHFACMEMPREMVTDMREFFGEFYVASSQRNADLLRC